MTGPVQPLAVASSASAPATIYRFTDPMEHGWGAYAMVSDATGWLSIMSDWGAWSYLWSPNPKHLGAPTLTHFIAGRNAVDYITDKLCGGWAKRRRFDIDLTVQHFQRELCRMRLEHAREEWRYLKHSGGLTKDRAREAWDALEELGGGDIGDGEQGATLFLERLYHYRVLSDLFPEAWDDLQHSETSESRVLRTRIVPALITACRAEVARRAAPPTSPLPHYAGYEEMEGRLRAYVPGALFEVCCDRSGHDHGDEGSLR